MLHFGFVIEEKGTNNLEAHKGVTHLVVQGGRSCLHTDTAIWLTSRLLERHQILGDPCGFTEGLLAEPH